MNILGTIDKSWTLFLDRDGVINHERTGEYVLHKGEFFFMDGAIDAVKYLSDVFGRIVLVTNQRGIGRQLMSDTDLADIHSYMLGEMGKKTARIDKIYYCSDVDNNCYERKPNPGMAFLAQKDFPEIDFSKSIIIGNKLSDMQFGRNAGMYTLFVATTNPEVPFPHPLIDFRCSDLAAAAQLIVAALKKH